MISNQLIFDFSTLEYPSREEVDTITATMPKFQHLGFPYANELKLILDESTPFEEAKKAGDLFWWDNHLSNKLGRLRMSYILAITNYNRGITSKDDAFSLPAEMNRILFEYYSESYYYFLFSARETILQIVNLYLDLKLQDHEVTLREILSRTSNSTVVLALKKFKRDMMFASNIRNSFTHKYPLTKKDFRAKIEQNDQEIRFLAGSGDSVAPAKVIKNMKSNLEKLKLFLDALRNEIKKTPQ